MLLASAWLVHELVSVYEMSSVTEGARLDRSNHMEEVEMLTNENRIVNQSVTQPRQDWESTFRAMAECGDDDLLDKDMLVETQWDETEWQW